MKRFLLPSILVGFLCANSTAVQSQQIVPIGPNSPCTAFGTASGQCAQGGVISAGGPIGSATVAPIITYNAAGQLTTVSSATVTPAIGSITGLGTGVATLLGGASSGTVGPAGTGSPTFTGAVALTASGNVPLAVTAGTGTNAVLFQQTNTGGSFYVGLENSTGTSLGSGVAYAGAVYNGANSPTVFYTNATAVARFSAAGGFSVGSTTDPGVGGLYNTGAVFHTGLGTDVALTDRSVCQVVSTGELKFGSGTLGICLGTSSERYKHGLVPLAPGLSELLLLHPKQGFLNKDRGDPSKLYYWITAEDMAKSLPKLVGLDKQGRPDTADLLGLVPVTVKAIQQLDHMNDNGVTTIDHTTKKKVCMYADRGAVKIKNGAC